VSPQGSLHTQADTSPNISRGLLLESLSNGLAIVVSTLAIRGWNADIVTCLWLPEAKVLGCQCFYIARGVNNTSSHTTSAANMNTDETVALEIQILMRTVSEWPINKYRRRRVLLLKLTPLTSVLKIASAAPE
jgi:hypothetical protein